MKFTKEEISLCKQVREKELLLKPVKEGDWIRNEYGKPSTDLVTSEYIQSVLRFTDIKHWFPLWTISDCLEFFKERELRYYIVTDNHSTTITIFNPKTDSIITQQSVENSKDSLGIACLKAVLAVLRDKS